MIFGLSVSELLVISLFFVTAFNCLIAYFCCSKSLKILEEDKSISRAVNKLRILDQYVMSKINIVIALLYFGLSYLFISNRVIDSPYVFFLACILSFPLTLITMVASRICYCYTCNILLDTRLNEFECLIVNLKRLLNIYLPFLVVSVVVPSIYKINMGIVYKNIMCVISLIMIMAMWVILMPKIMYFDYNARKVNNNSMLYYRISKLMEGHGVKKFKLYCWDSSKSREANAMVSGIFTCHLFISSCLVEELTLPELETVITHEIGHVKNNHLLKGMIGKLFLVSSLLLISLAPYFFNFKNYNMFFFYVIAFIFLSIGLVVAVQIEKKYENEADFYASCYNDPVLFISALKKITKYEEGEDRSRLDELFQSHPNVNERINKFSKK